MTTAEEPSAVPTGSPLLSGNEQWGLADTSVVGTDLPPQSGQQRVRQSFGLGASTASVSEEQLQIILAALAAGGEGAKLDPVQVQHLLFLIDVTVADAVGGPHFEFVPSPAGPVAPSVKASLLQLGREGRLSTGTESRDTVVLLTVQGLSAGEAVLSRFGTDLGLYLRELHAWVGAHDFRQRLSVIRNYFPDAISDHFPTAMVQAPGDDPRRRLIWEYTKQPRWRAILRGAGRSVDLYGTLNDNYRVLGALQTSRGASAPPRDNWTEVGDYLREAMAQFVLELPSSIRDEDARVA